MVNLTGSTPVQNETLNEINLSGGLRHSSFFFSVSGEAGGRAVCRTRLISFLLPAAGSRITAVAGHPCRKTQNGQLITLRPVTNGAHSVARPVDRRKPKIAVTYPCSTGQSVERDSFYGKECAEEPRGNRKSYSALLGSLV